MNTSPQPFNPADYYFGFLKNLKHNTKLDLITKLSESLKTTEQKENTSLQSLFGACKSEETAEEMIADLRSSRVFTRTIESL